MTNLGREGQGYSRAKLVGCAGAGELLLQEWVEPVPRPQGGVQGSPSSG